MKPFLITIDTEGDNLWNFKIGNTITTENTVFLNRFQSLCEEYGFKPVWLTNHEMISAPRYVSFIADVEARHVGEIGMHLHAWNNPPIYNLPVETEHLPYLIEYPIEIMEEKISLLTELIIKETGIKPVSHRAGRWATNDKYFDLLVKYGYKVDCSVTPHVNWSNSQGITKNSGGSDYSKAPECAYRIDTTNGSLLEVPVSIRKTHHYFKPSFFSVRKVIGSVYKVVKGMPIWFRPTVSNIEQMKYFVRQTDNTYLMFMLHSSEMMPGGSPNFKTKNDIDILYRNLREIFALAVENGYKGMTLRDFERCSQLIGDKGI